MKNKKIVLRVIIVLLIIFLPLTIISTVYKIMNPYVVGNPKREFKYNNSLWFYDDNKNFLSKYDCHTETCDYTTPIIDDNMYGNDYYQGSIIAPINIINNIYTFITDGDIVYLYNIKNGNILQEYKAIKNYYTNLDNNEYIIKNKDNMWGVISFGNVLSNIIPFEYDFIGLINNYNNENSVLSTDNFIVSKNGKWQIITHDNQVISTPIDYPIVNYNNKYIISSDQGRYYLFDYKGKEYFKYSVITKYYLIDKYVAIEVNNNIYIYNNLDDSYLETIDLSTINGEIYLEIEDDDLIIKNNNEVIKKIENND